MTQDRFPLAYLSFLAVLVLFLTAGCVNKAAFTAGTHQEEQLYIDAKLGFTVLYPLPWKKNRLPVSSPSYRDDSISWDIPSGDGTGKMLIRVYPAMTSTGEPASLFEEFLADGPEYSSEEVTPYQHDAGEAVVTTIHYQGQAQRLFAILGSKNTYILSFVVSTENFEDHIPLFDRVADSFNEL